MRPVPVRNVRDGRARCARSHFCAWRGRIPGGYRRIHGGLLVLGVQVAVLHRVGDRPGTRTRRNDLGEQQDECVRPDASLEAMAKLRPSFRTEAGTVTAGNASPLNDGAAAVLLVGEEGLKATGREPLARISATGVHALDPDNFGLAPVEAVNRALAKAGKGFDDLSVLELNEAFAARSSAVSPSGPSSTRRSSTRMAAPSRWAPPARRLRRSPRRHHRPPTRSQGQRRRRGHPLHRRRPEPRPRPRTLTSDRPLSTRSCFGGAH
jgi:hypothetical protein